MEEQGVDCVFGSRFIRGARWLTTHVSSWCSIARQQFHSHPLQIALQRMKMLQIIPQARHRWLKPFLSHHFNLTVELPLKAIVLGYRYAVVPNDWINRKAGESSSKAEMGSRYLSSCSMLIEKWLSKKDYHRRSSSSRRLKRMPRRKRRLDHSGLSSSKLDESDNTRPSRIA